MNEQEFRRTLENEWLETNGLGGWAGASVSGCSTSRYHGLLVAATTPPAERMNLLSRLEETICSDTRYELSCNEYRNAVFHPAGYHYLEKFTRDLFPCWTYVTPDGTRLTKTIAMVHGENSTLILYQVEKAPAPFTLELLPLISAKYYHALQHASTDIWWDVEFRDGIFRNQPLAAAPPVYISVPGSAYRHDPRWYYRFNYAVDKARGQEYEEDLFNHGVLTVNLREGDVLGIIISTDNPAGRDAATLLAAESGRRERLLASASATKPVPAPLAALHRQLVLAADQFIVRRDPGSSVIAGYHWFTDWSRDTMIALPGLCLATGRTDDMRLVLRAFAASVSMGMLPNRFMDRGEAPEYNTVDGSLWYFIAIHHYLEMTGDRDFVIQELLPVLSGIIDWHFKGTRYNIHVDPDGLLYSGQKDVQLTWMDARQDDRVVTPRMGRPVEIQALWYNALRIYADLLSPDDRLPESDRLPEAAARVKDSFLKLFWYAKGGYLYDNIDENGLPDPALRPNQLLALSLPYPLLEADQALKILQVVKEELLTPVGLRSLAPSDPRYSGKYLGGPAERDGAYHQGTVWSWLLGPYMDALKRYSPHSPDLLSVISACQYHLSEAGIGTVSEIFDGDWPHHPRGCIAQAWGVAEWLRML